MWENLKWATYFVEKSQLHVDLKEVAIHEWELPRCHEEYIKKVLSLWPIDYKEWYNFLFPGL